VGAGVAWIVGPQLTFLRLAPKQRMAQITGTMVALLALAEGLGSLGFAHLADTAGVHAAYRLAAIVILLAAVVGWFVKSRTPEAAVLDRGELPVREPSPA
jgi:predicted MFS family arabinose efflux permease